MHCWETNSNEHSSHKMKLYEMNVVNPSQKRVLTKPDMNKNTNKYHVLGQNRIWAVSHFSYFFAHVMQGNSSKFKFLKIIFLKRYYRIDCVQESASSKKKLEVSLLTMTSPRPRKMWELCALGTIFFYTVDLTTRELVVRYKHLSNCYYFSPDNGCHITDVINID